MRYYSLDVTGRDWAGFPATMQLVLAWSNIQSSVSRESLTRDFLKSFQLEVPPSRAILKVGTVLPLMSPVLR